MIKTIIFDMDGVLCRYQIDRRLALLSKWSGQSPDAIFDAIWRSGFENEAECGFMSAEEYLRGVGDRLKYPLSLEQWIEARQISIDPDEETLALAQRLSAQYPIGLFTNNPWLLKKHFAQVFPKAHTLFGDRAIFSAELGCRKPEPQAFHRLADRWTCEPAEILYFDDNASYIAGALEAGLIAYHVSGIVQIRAGLIEHGIDV